MHTNTRPTDRSRWRALLVVAVLTAVVLATGVVGTATAQQSGPTPLVSCQEISTPGTYVLDRNLTSTDPVCLHVTASDVVIDGNGYTIEGDGTGYASVLVDGSGPSVSNVTVRDLKAEAWTRGVEAAQAVDVTVANASFYAVDTGVRAVDVGGSIIVANTEFVAIGDDAVSVDGAMDVDVRDTQMSSVGGAGILVRNANDVTLRDNAIVDSNTAEADDSFGIEINTSTSAILENTDVEPYNLTNGVKIVSTETTITDLRVDGTNPHDYSVDTRAIVVVDSTVDVTGFDVPEMDTAAYATDSTVSITDATVRKATIRGSWSDVELTNVTSKLAGNSIIATYSNFTVSDSIIDGNGAVRSSNSTMTFDRVRVDATSGIRASHNSTVTVRNGNFTARLEAFEGEESAFTIRNTTVHDANHAVFLESNSEVVVADSEFHDVYEGFNVTSSTATLANVTMTGAGPHYGIRGWSSSIDATDLTVDGGTTGLRLTDSTANVSDSSIDAWSTGVQLYRSNVSVNDTVVTDAITGLDAYSDSIIAARNVSLVDVRDGLDSDADSLIRATTVSVDAERDALVSRRGGHIQFYNGTIVSDGIGVRVTHHDSTVEVINASIEADVGVHLTSDVEIANESLIAFSDLTGTNVSIQNEAPDPLAVPLNYWGPRGEVDAVGPVTNVEPFLTASPQNTSLRTLQEFGIDLEMPAGGVYSFGTPGGLDGTLSEVFDDFDGAIYRYDADAQAWTLADGTERLEALEAVVVVPETDARAVVDFRDATPAQPTQRTLKPGWQFMAPRSYDSAEAAFDTRRTLAAIDLLNLYELPTGQPALPYHPHELVFTSYEFQETESTYLIDDRYVYEQPVSPYGGYFVYVTEESTVPARVPNGVTYDELAEMLELDQVEWFGGAAT
ncbi:right-handed parallel beta-helix repeat-containing protein [Natronosalvus caseinilyticus]|uniref:right-handed parallel beta-helix repeat-containing protein n=1 Tax=Natronosalvus caseinilyticus TaxID=2953747 RepID=UPI0028A602C4|nr:right-handed parallel beta-helix repeat-containing protein [Natronosalvus caseinilyticus]